jgi:hypothetical protein
LRQDLQCNFAPQLCIRGAVHFAHSARPNRGIDSVMRECTTDQTRPPRTGHCFVCAALTCRRELYTKPLLGPAHQTQKLQVPADSANRKLLHPSPKPPPLRQICLLGIPSSPAEGRQTCLLHQANIGISRRRARPVLEVRWEVCNRTAKKGCSTVVAASRFLIRGTGIRLARRGGNRRKPLKKKERRCF